MPAVEPREWRRSRRLRRPSAPDCIIVVEPNGGLSAEEIWRAMSASECWNPAGMHPRTPRVLAIGGGWVFKADFRCRTLDRAAAEARLRCMTELTARLAIWHPAKSWFLLRDRRRYFPCSATPFMRTVDEVRGVRRCWASAQMTWLGSIAACRGFVLDARSVNFGFEEKSWRVYYIDDEVYLLRRVGRKLHTVEWLAPHA